MTNDVSRQQALPVEIAKDVLEKNGFRQVVILANDQDNVNHIITYGDSKENCKQAGLAGDFWKDVLGWPPEKRSKYTKQQPEVTAPVDVEKITDCLAYYATGGKNTRIFQEMADDLYSKLMANGHLSGRDEWKTIDTAPRDGTTVLVCWAINADGEYIDWTKDLKTATVFCDVATYDDECESKWRLYTDRISEPCVPYHPTHWKHLPTPPKEQL